ncbi:hypothetical protein Hsar01_00324 [Haloferula sargassicola]|uniref:Uncharacterized protein n=1 Tax=Haloferula sargassicola TaxID=490096 RepID=A0ABP9UKD3_9BACT
MVCLCCEEVDRHKVCFALTPICPQPLLPLSWPPKSGH